LATDGRGEGAGAGLASGCCSACGVMSSGPGARATREASGRGEAFGGAAAVEVAGNSANNGFGAGGAAGRVMAYPKNRIPMIRTSRPRIWLPRTDGEFPATSAGDQDGRAAHCKQKDRPKAVPVFRTCIIGSGCDRPKSLNGRRLCCAWSMENVVIHTDSAGNRVMRRKLPNAWTLLRDFVTRVLEVEGDFWRLTKDQIGPLISGSPVQWDFLRPLASGTFWSRKVTLRGIGPPS